MSQTSPAAGPERRAQREALFGAWREPPQRRARDRIGYLLLVTLPALAMIIFAAWRLGGAGAARAIAVVVGLSVITLDEWWTGRRRLVIDERGVTELWSGELYRWADMERTVRRRDSLEVMAGGRRLVVGSRFERFEELADGLQTVIEGAPSAPEPRGRVAAGDVGEWLDLAPGDTLTVTRWSERIEHVGVGAALALGLWLLWRALTGALPPMADPVGVVAGVAGGLLLAGGWALRRLREARLRVEVDLEGWRIWEGRRRRVYGWDDLVEVRQRDGWDFEFADGWSLSLRGWGWQNAQRLAEAAKTAVAARQQGFRLPAADEHAERGLSPADRAVAPAEAGVSRVRGTSGGGDG